MLNPVSVPGAACLPPPPSSIEAISLDLDDTLWPVLPTLIHAEKTLANWLAANAPGAAALYTDENRGRYRRAAVEAQADKAHDMSFIRTQTLRLALQEAGEAPGLADEGFEVFLAARQQVTLYDDVWPVLRAWHSSLKLIAISNGNADLNRIGLGELFTAQVSAHEAGFAKPDPRIFQLACDEAGVTASATLHIGDDYTLDYQGARQAGLHAAWLRRPSLKPPKPPRDGQDPVTTTPFVGLAQIQGWLTGQE